MAVADRHDLASLTASSRANGSARFFRPGERGVDEGFGQIDLAAVSQVFGESLEQDLKASGSLPQLKATMAGLIRRIAARQIVPRSARAQDPEDAVEDRPRRRPGAPSSIWSTSRSKDRLEDGPLLIGEIHAPECSKKKLPLGALIVHLNDAHHWTRERIAAWVGDPDVPQDESHAHH
jgi:hypothetical protein